MKWLLIVSMINPVTTLPEPLYTQSYVTQADCMQAMYVYKRYWELAEQTGTVKCVERAEYGRVRETIDNTLGGL